MKQFVAIIRRGELRRRVPIAARDWTDALARADLVVSRRNAERLVMLYECSADEADAWSRGPLGLSPLHGAR